MTSFVQKILNDSDRDGITDDTKRAKTNQIIILQWHTGFDEETFAVNINTQNS